MTNSQVIIVLISKLVCSLCMQPFFLTKLPVCFLCMQPLFLVDWNLHTSHIHRTCTQKHTGCSLYRYVHKFAAKTKGSTELLVSPSESSEFQSDRAPYIASVQIDMLLMPLLNFHPPLWNCLSYHGEDPANRATKEKIRSSE
uniref:Uncharacterized protein n=1 Tax=Opuntia streptacantha TaxID=393608 RepID=A0A7C9DTA6_OPUST